MAKLNKTQAFAVYGAKLKNTRWAYSATADDGSIVVSCWGQYFRELDNGIWRYNVHDFGNWTSMLGKNLFKEHLKYALDRDKSVRLIIAQEKDKPAPIVAGVDGANIPKEFIVRKNLVGKVVKFDYGQVVIDFSPALE